MKKTYMAKMDEISPEWFVVDAQDVVLGRLASFVASRLRGKHKPEFTPNQLCGDTIVIVNADKVRVTGNKMKDKRYYWHTGYTIKTRTLSQMLDTHPIRVIEKAVKGMLPKSRLADRMYGRLKVYAGETHPHVAQNPQPLTIS